MIKILQRGQHGHAICLGSRKTNLSTILCTELDLGLFMKDVDKDVIFHLPLDVIH